MSRDSYVSKQIYRKHLALYKHINNAWIFSELLKPDLEEKSKKLCNSTSSAKKPYKTPKKLGWVNNKRRDKEIGALFQSQLDRGMYETNIVSLVSRVEAFIQDCISIVACAHPQKLKILADKGGVPVDLVLENENRDDLIKRFVAIKCEGLMFSKPKEYLDKASKVISIELDSETIENYIEIKASRDLVIHGYGKMNAIYLEKAGRKARGALGETLEVDREYFRNVIVKLKALSAEFQKQTEAKYQ